MEASVREKFDSYPERARAFLEELRGLILQVAEEQGIGPPQESLKWGEPSYAVKGGCAVRIDWKPKFPDSCFVYFQCQTRLVETFREIYGDVFEYEGKRAIVLSLGREVPLRELKHCISLSLRYHSLKQLPLLGA